MLISKKRKAKLKSMCKNCKINPKEAKWSTEKRMKALQPVLDVSKI